MYILLVKIIDSFDCSKLFNRVEPITQTRPDKTRGKEEKENKEEKEEKEKRRKRRKGEKGEKGGKGGKGEK